MPLFPSVYAESMEAYGTCEIECRKLRTLPARSASRSGCPKDMVFA